MKSFCLIEVIKKIPILPSRPRPRRLRLRNQQLSEGTRMESSDLHGPDVSWIAVTRPRKSVCHSRDYCGLQIYWRAWENIWRNL